ncbi:hypothetical protein HZC07_04330, partial [Candidatus Micrarchaeota archaeon]|nr:hypothetical protein [Candidatus Micrarchaeota archaeon]
FSFSPLHDETSATAPYTQEERLIVVPSGKVYEGAVSTSLDLGHGLEIPIHIIVGEMSFGATVGGVQEAIGIAAQNTDIIFGIGEGGWYSKIRENKRVMVQVASGVFGITVDGLKDAVAVSIKLAQSAKAGMGGHAKGHKITPEMARTRGMPLGIDYISDANRIFSVEEMRQLVRSIRRAAGEKPVFIKCAATHDIAAIVAGAIEAGADGVIIDGRGGGTGTGAVIVKNHSCDPIELAVALGDKKRWQMGAENFRIIAAGRVCLPRKAIKLHLLGADAVMLGTAAMIAMGCIMVHTCHKRCPTLLATAIGERELHPELAAHVLGSYIRTFARAEETYAAQLGFSSIAALRGRRDLLRGIALDPELREVLGVAEERNLVVEREVAELWTGEVTDPYHPWQLAHIDTLGREGKLELGSMGRTTDCDPPRSYIDGVITEGRHGIGPAFDQRDGIETGTILPGNFRINMPFMLDIEGTSNKMDLIKIVAGHRIGVLAAYEKVEKLMAEFGERPVLSRAGHILLRISNVNKTRIEEISDGIGLQLLRKAAGIVLDKEDITRETLRYLQTYSPVPVYAAVAANGNVESTVMQVATSGVKGVLIEGRIGIGKVALGSDTPLPLELAIPIVDDLLMSRVHESRLLRTKLALLAVGNIRGPDDAFILSALGANAVVGTEVRGEHGRIETRKELEGVLDGYEDEIRALMGSSGVSMLSSVIGNRDLLRADEIPPRIRTLMGLRFMGK